ncbi:hypothetical protein KAM428_39850 [Aquipseudomonas alcaligenes]|uniref:Uncharacterized protein n=1 Tax=Aquipseudomonas alcaligenes TaxID=43263 RepID=A0ABD0B168_AQUAC|nr:hypothetical protein KAM426_18810 [Pseudomonas alcaligenes]GIZ68900.1 hypothetical protein KAM428_39850 [Pseudomonas alcaligenes]GIZ81993.1 hypothetical protein KAM432_40410 [Pseudomonas alcaligenes]GIZ86323.1 hypothetical protein KAM434_40180 [Pseudomonas alcaligenes]GIZ95072.1 hypothetical protein KAM436_40400 [Pseudomonas alcaligenes]
MHALDRVALAHLLLLFLLKGQLGAVALGQSLGYGEGVNLYPKAAMLGVGVILELIQIPLALLN